MAFSSLTKKKRKDQLAQLLNLGVPRVAIAIAIAINSLVLVSERFFKGARLGWAEKKRTCAASAEDSLVPTKITAVSECCLIILGVAHFWGKDFAG